jgi:hypothetical protein
LYALLFAPFHLDFPPADVTEHGCLTTVSASGAAEAADPEAGHMVTSISELDENAAARVVAELAANGRA